MRDYNIRTAAAAVLYDTSTLCTYSSLEPLVPGAAHLVYQAGSTCSRAHPAHARDARITPIHALIMLLRSTNRGDRHETTHGVAVSYEFICSIKHRAGRSRHGPPRSIHSPRQQLLLPTTRQPQPPANQAHPTP